MFFLKHGVDDVLVASQINNVRFSSLRVVRTRTSVWVRPLHVQHVTRKLLVFSCVSLKWSSVRVCREQSSIIRSP